MEPGRDFVSMAQVVFSVVKLALLWILAKPEIQARLKTVSGTKSSGHVFPGALLDCGHRWGT